MFPFPPKNSVNRNANIARLSPRKKGSSLAPPQAVLHATVDHAKFGSQIAVESEEQTALTSFSSAVTNWHPSRMLKAR